MGTDAGRSRLTGTRIHHCKEDPWDAGMRACAGGEGSLQQSPPMAAGHISGPVSSVQVSLLSIAPF